MHNVNPRLAATIAPPVMEARRWLEGVNFPADRPLLNLSQAAPVDPPPEGLRRAMADALMKRDDSHLYGPVLGLEGLRSELAVQWSANYGGHVSPDQVAITAGCNQAFCAVVATLAQAGDAVILPVPWYFNHKMWLDQNGIETQVLATGEDLIPDAGAAEAQITPRTRAIVLVTPNNPGGVEYSAATMEAFRDLARRRGIALIVDETYRDFHGLEGAPHGLIADPDWDDTVITLYSFSKSFRLTGHRVGAILSSPARLAEVEKFLDCVAICPSQVGQIGALWGMENLRDWLAGERLEILRRRNAMQAAFQRLPDWQLLGCGAYFAYVRHPFADRSDIVAQRLVHNASLLTLPGTMFGPLRNAGGMGQAETTLRLAFANADIDGLAELGDRLAALTT
jgi:aspartate/methionine/tyrosine aminotransferase